LQPPYSSIILQNPHPPAQDLPEGARMALITGVFWIPAPAPDLIRGSPVRRIRLKQQGIEP
jgi:hypothetical protein